MQLTALRGSTFNLLCGQIFRKVVALRGITLTIIRYIKEEKPEHHTPRGDLLIYFFLQLTLVKEI